MTLSDVLSEAVEKIWEAVEEYPVAEEHKEQIFGALQSLEYVRIYRDMGVPNCASARVDELIARAHAIVCKRWATRCCGPDYWQLPERAREVDDDEDS